MSDHDAQCTYGPEWDRMKGGARGCPECDLIARVRADALAEFEGATVMDRRAWRDEFVAGRVEAEVRERLRAQVEALPQHEFLVGSPLAGDGWAQYAAAGVRRSDVLALLGGESDE